MIIPLARLFLKLEQLNIEQLESSRTTYKVQCVQEQQMDKEIEKR